MRREEVWTSYHSVQTSETYHTLWSTFLDHLGVKSTPIFCQNVGNLMLKELLTNGFPIKKIATKTGSPDSPTQEEGYGLTQDF